MSGRYTAPLAAPAPATGLATASSSNVATTTAAVVDPYAPERRLQVTVRRDIDVLEWELSHGRLSEAAYLAGRELQRAYERLPATGGASNWRGGDRIDPLTAQGQHLDRLQLAVHNVRCLEQRAARIIGTAGVAFLALVLRDGRTFAELAELEPRQSQTSIIRAADRFRWLLHALAEGWAAHGPATPR